MMDRETIIKGLEIERECVSRDCDRNCLACDLVQDKGWLLEVYDGAIVLVSQQDTTVPQIAHLDGGTTWWYSCGACRAPINPKDKYCHECGRPVKWDE